MFKVILKSWGRYLGGWASFFLIIAIIIMCALGALMIRLNQGPLDLEFAKSKIENALSDLERNYVVQIDKAYLTWPDVSAPFLLQLSKVEITQEVETVLAVDDFSLVLSGLDLLQGKILPSRIIVTEPEFKVFDDRGYFNAFWRGENKKQKQVYGPVQPLTTKENIRDLLSRITNPKNQELRILSALRTVQIKDAQLLGAKNEILADLNLTLKKHEEGLVSDLSVTYSEVEGKASRFDSGILYRREQEDLTLTATLHDFHSTHLQAFTTNIDWLKNQNLLVNGDLKAALNKNLDLDNASLKLNVPDARFSLPDVYEAPLRVEDLLADIVFNHKEKKLSLENLSFKAASIPIVASLKGKYKDGVLSAPLDIKIPSSSIENLRKLLPKSQDKKPGGAWLNRKLETGNVQNAQLKTNLSLKQNLKTKKYDVDFDEIKASFDFTDMTIKYSPTLIPVVRAKGSGRYENDTLYIDSPEGYIKDLKGSDVKVEVTKLSVAGGGVVDVNVKASGPLKTALEYVSMEPINAGDNLGFDVNDVQGNIDFKLNINLPSIRNVPKEKVNVTLKGVVNDIVLPNVVRGLSITGGPYDLDYGQGSVSLKGLGQLSGRNIDLNWKQNINPTGKEFESQIKATIVADASLRQNFGVGLTDYISGPIPIDIVYTDKGANADLDVTANLTPAIVRIDNFGYIKPVSSQGVLSLKAKILGPDLQEINNLNLQADGLSISGGQLFFAKNNVGETDIKHGNIADVKLKKNQVNVEFEITNDNTLKAIVNGPIVDVSRFIDTDKKKADDALKGDNRRMALSINADTMLLTNAQKLTNTKLYLELNKDNQPTRIEMDASVGAGEMFVRFKPDENGKSNFDLNSTDAGAMLKAFGLYDKMRGGEMIISGQPKTGEAGNNLYGRAKITDFSVRGAPALAKMMDAMSLKGVDNLISNDGIVFKKLASDFEWKFKEAGNLLVLKEGRTSGSSLGLTFEGFVNMGESKIDLSGTAIPLSGVSKVIGEIPLIGDLLTGGGEGLFAATYEMKGPTNDPKVTMNPLSVLAPGFVRKILFEDDVDKKVKKEEAKQ